MFEVSLGEDVSCGGCGRYDDLIERVGGQSTPATGISLGLDRIFELMKENEMFDEEAITKIFVANVDEKTKDEALKIAEEFRRERINCQTDLMDRKLSQQLEYANSVKIPFVVIVGEKEIKSKKFKLKNMKKKTEKELKLKEIIDTIHDVKI